MAAVLIDTWKDIKAYKGGYKLRGALTKKALPMEEHDVIMDYVVTEKRIIIEDLRNF